MNQMIKKERKKRERKKLIAFINQINKIISNFNLLILLLRSCTWVPRAQLMCSSIGNQVLDLI